MSDLPPDGAPWPDAVAALARDAREVFGALERWCAERAEVLDHRPVPGAWTGREVLEHVHLADHFLFLLAEKIRDRCARRLERGDAWPARPARLRFLEPIASHELRWPHPEHMTPRGGRSRAELAADLRGDLERTLALLDAMPTGEGTLHTIRMSVVGERLDLYQYLTVVVLHGERHAGQLARNRRRFEE